MKKKSFWIFASGAAIMTIGLFLLAFGLVSQEPGGSMIPTSSFVFSFGAVLLAAGFYMRFRDLEKELRPAKEAKKLRNDLFRAHGACSVCKENPAMIRCSVHNAAVCPVCMSLHDSAWCEYAPMGRRSTATRAGAWR